MTDRREWKYMRIGTNFRVSRDDDMRMKLGSVTQYDVRPHYAKRSDFNIFAQFCTVFDDRSGVNIRH